MAGKYTLLPSIDVDVVCDDNFRQVIRQCLILFLFIFVHIKIICLYPTSRTMFESTGETLMYL